MQTAFKPVPNHAASVPESTRATPTTAVRMAYLLSRYPAISHTFFLQEVLGLRARGLYLKTASINPPDRLPADLPAAEAQEAAQTFYLKSGSKLRVLLNVTAACAQAPLALLRGLGAVLRMPRLTLRQRGFWLFYLAEAMLLGGWMRRQKLTHLHVHFGGAVASVGMLAAIAWQLPFSLTIHGPEELLNTDAYHLREKLAAAQFVFCISDFCRSQLYQLADPGDWRKFHVVRLGVDPVMLTPPDNRGGHSDEGAESRLLEFVCTGRLVAAKGHQTLLQALLLLRERGTFLHLTLIGAGPERERLDRFVAQHELEDLVTFTSALSHSETLAHLRRADAFVLASFAEGIPVAIMEAMSLGLPCISTTIAGIPELIDSGTSGLLVPPGNSARLADALEQLILSDSLRRRLGSNARQRIISQYNLPLNQELLAHSFDLLTGAKR